MTYFTGSTSNTATPGKDFMELTLHPNLLAVGFTYVEEVVGPSTYVARVYKSPAASNGVGDWYLATNRNSDTYAAVVFAVSEQYDQPNHKMVKFAPPGTVSGGQAIPADRTHPTIAGVVPSSATLQSSPAGVGLSTAAHAYVMSLNTKRIVISTRVTSTDYLIYCGFYDSALYGVANDYPLLNSCLNGSNYSSGTTFTREPGTGSTSDQGYGNSSFSTMTGTANWQSAVPTYQLDGYYLKPTATMLLIPASQSKSGFRGYAIGLYAANNAFAWGDIANVNWDGVTVTATCVYGSGSYQRLVDQAL